MRSFALLSLAIVVVIGVVVGVFLRSTVRDRAIDDAVRTAQVAVGVGVLPLLTVDDIDRSFVPLDPARVEEIDAALSGSLAPNGITRIKVWNRQHWIVYSDNPRLVGRWFAGTELLERTFDGELTSEVTDLTAPEEREEREFGELLSVYVPLRGSDDGRLSVAGDDEIIGAFEIYLPYAPIAAAIDRDTLELYVVLAGGLLVLYLVLFRIVGRAARTITRQGDENLRRATTDELTGLANRERFQDRLAELVGLPADSVSLLLFDVDGFQRINDTLGHDRGDEVIRCLAERLVAGVRGGDMVARLGGDEFGIILNGADGGLHETIARRLLRTLDDPVVIDGIALDVRCSVGMSRFPEHGRTASELLRRADIAMYAAKRDQTVLEEFEPELDHYSADALELVGDVRAGITRGDFWLAYQSQVAIDTGAVVGFEALVRWKHATRGNIAPGAFMPTLETLPACRELTDHLLAMAVAQLGRWRAAGHDVSVAVNLSPRDAADRALPGYVAGLLDQHRVVPSALHLELTEGTALANPTLTRDVLGGLRQLGCHVAIDDFGTGFASLSYLTSLPITALKIDRSFVSELVSSDRGAAIVRHSIELGHSLGLTVIAEGVEDAVTLDALAALGCDVAQGFHLSRPVPATDVGLDAPAGALADAPEAARTDLSAPGGAA